MSYIIIIKTIITINDYWFKRGYNKNLYFAVHQGRFCRSLHGNFLCLHRRVLYYYLSIITNNDKFSRKVLQELLFCCTPCEVNISKCCGHLSWGQEIMDTTAECHFMPIDHTKANSQGAHFTRSLGSKAHLIVVFGLSLTHSNFLLR